MSYDTLAEFRDGLSLCFERAGDALMNTADALLTETAARSLPELSLSPCFRRKWHSLYEAFADAKINRSHLQRLFAAFVPNRQTGQRLVLGINPFYCPPAVPNGTRPHLCFCLEPARWVQTRCGGRAVCVA